MNIEALKELAAKVEAGEWDHSPNGAARKVFPYKSASIDDLGLIAAEAFNGSLDAAKVLHDALVPGWTIHIGTENNGEFHVIVGSPSNVRLYDEAFNAIMARAWLLAILRALIDKPEGEG